MRFPEELEIVATCMAKLRRGWFKVRFSIPFLLAAGLLAGCDEWFDHRRAFEVTVDLIAEGQRLKITRRIMCIGEVRREALVKKYIHYTPSALSFGERLPSGGAVMVVTPAFCSSVFREGGDESKKLQVSEKHIPYIGWVDNPDRPEAIEAFVSAAYFKSPTARIRYVGMSARVIEPELAKEGAVDEFDWFGKRPTWNIHYAFYAVPIPATKWRQIENAQGLLADLNTPTAIPVAKFPRRLWEFSVPYQLDRLFDGRGLSGTPSPNDSRSHYTLKPHELRNMENFFPLIKGPAGFAIDSERRNHLIFYRSVKRWPNSTTSFLVGDTPFLLPTTGRDPPVVYDPRSGTLFYVGVVAINFPVHLGTENTSPKSEGTTR